MGKIFGASARSTIAVKGQAQVIMMSITKLA